MEMTEPQSPAEKYLTDRIVELGDEIEQEEKKLMDMERDVRNKRTLIQSKRSELEKSADALAVLRGTKKVAR